MATNKHAIIRYNTLDKCFRNTGKKCFVEDLIEECSDALYRNDGSLSGIQRRQIFKDISFMESEDGWSISLDRIKEGRKVYYRYEDTSFSISNQAMTVYEAEHLKESLLTLTRFRGLPQFDWINEMITRLEDSFILESDRDIISFDDNEYLEGRDYISVLYDAILNKYVLDIEYKSFKRDDLIKMEIHPYYIKQYNRRWFLFGLLANKKIIANIALDRIQSIKQVGRNYEDSENFDSDEYFEDIVGVSVPKEGEVEKVLLKVDSNLFPYIQTKPVHGSQKVVDKQDGYFLVELELIINYEFKSLLLSMGNGIEVVEPMGLRDGMREVLDLSLKKYS